MFCVCLFTPQLLVKFLAIVATVCASNPWVLIPATLITVTFLLLRTYYLKTSRELKRLEAVGEFINPRHSCMRVTVVVLCVCVCYRSSSFSICLYPQTTILTGLSLDFDSLIFEKTSVQKLKSQYANESASREGTCC